MTLPIRTASKHVYCLGWNRSPAQVGCMRQVLGPDALGRPRGIRWRGRWEGGSGWGMHVYPWLTDVYVWQKPLQYCKVISLQLIKKEREKKKKQTNKKKKNKQSKSNDLHAIHKRKAPEIRVWKYDKERVFCWGRWLHIADVSCERK